MKAPFIHDHFKCKLQKEKVKEVQSLMAENRKFLKERRVLMENCAGMKSQSPDNRNEGFILFKKSLEFEHRRDKGRVETSRRDVASIESN